MGEDKGKSASVMERLGRWVIGGLVLVITIGAIWATVRAEPDHLHTAFVFQRARADLDWDQVWNLMSDDYALHGGRQEDLPEYLSVRVSNAWYRMPVPAARVDMGRESEGLLLVNTNWAKQHLCLEKHGEGEWRILPSPFLLYHLEHQSQLADPGELFSAEGEMLVLPRTPAPGQGQARILADALWVRVTPAGTMRVLVMVRVEGTEVDLSLRNILAETRWEDGVGESSLANRITWTDVWPPVYGVWPLSPGAALFDLEWEQVPDDTFVIRLGSFVFGAARDAFTIPNLSLHR